MDEEDAADVKDCWEDSDDNDVPEPVIPAAVIKSTVIAAVGEEANDDEEDDADDTASISSASTASGAGEKAGVRGGFDSDADLDDLTDDDVDDLEDDFEGGNIPRVDKLVETWLLKYAKRTTLNASFSENNAFLIDLDCLLLQCLQDSSLPWQRDRIQFLHVIYLVERYLKFFIDKGGNFEFVVFAQSEVIWRDAPALLLMRWILIHHIECNTAFSIKHFANCYCDPFDIYVTRINPIFLLSLIWIDDITKAKLRMEQVSQYLFITCCSLLKRGLSIALGDTLHYSFAQLDAYWIEPVSEKVIDWNPNLALPKLSSEGQDFGNLPTESTLADFRTLVQDLENPKLALAALAFDQMKQREWAFEQEYIQAYSWCSAVCTELPFAFRCRKLEPDVNSKFNAFLEDFTLCAASILRCLPAPELAEFSPDFFDFNVLSVIVRNGFGARPHCNPAHASFLKRFGISCDMITNGVAAEPSEGQDAEVEFSHASSKTEYIKASAPIISEYVSDMEQVVKYLKNPSESKSVQSKLAVDKQFEERFRWNATAPITDEYTRTKDNSDDKKEVAAVGFNRRDQRRQLRRQNAQKQKFVRFMTRYGQSLEGGVTVTSEKIVTCAALLPEKGGVQKKKDKKIAVALAPQKMSKASQKIIEKNIMEKKSARENECRRQMLEFRGKISSLENRPGKLFPELDNLKSYYKEFRLLEKDFTLYITDVMSSVLSHVSTTMGDYKITLEAKIQVVALIRDVYKLREHWSSKTELVITKLCCKCAFHDILSSFNLACKKHETFNDSFPCFQLRDMGHLLVRDVRSDPDPRISRFIPDTWQRELFDAIDNNQSALIIAPTSSGKTYASYYCMEQILKQDDDGVIVYVSPTKALVNQVAATICARYEKNLPVGKTLYGVFTRDYRQNVKTCQILITVPECLEILLLSETNAEWIPKIKYVIFDEVHCIGMNEASGSGITWEHCITAIMCPFLALSATVENPDMLHNWLQNAEDFKKTRDELTKTPRKNAPLTYNVVKVEYRLRHNDLDHYLFHNNSLAKVHPCSFFDEKTAEDYDVYPQHVLLSSSESLQLFEKMKGIEPSRLARFEPGLYFKDALFVSKNSVTMYAKELLEELWEWKKLYSREEFLDRFRRVVKTLSDADGMRIKIPPTTEEIHDNFVPLLDMLQEKNMLPAIVFCENRVLCEELVGVAADHVKEKNRQAVDLKDDKAREKIQMKAEKLAKKQVMKDGKEKNKDMEGSKLDMMMQARDEVALTQKEVFSYAGKTCDEEDRKYAYDRMRLNDLPPTDSFRFGLEHGVSFHHSGMNAKMRGGVEMLFRLKHLQVVIATGTLAMGIHVPCRTVVFTYDSPYFNTLTFRQMSGRAGRRGFDLKGNVVFSMVPYSKVQSLITSKLPRLMGNFPISVSLVLRLLLLVAKGDAPQRLTSALALLNHPLILQHYEISAQLKLHFLFSVQFLVQQNFIDTDAKPMGFTGLVTHLYHHEPANFVFLYLLKRGYFHQLLLPEKDKSSFSKELMKNLVGVLAHLFTDMQLPRKFNRKFQTSIVHLRDLRFSPGGSYGTFQQAIESYNAETKEIFDGFLVASSKKEPSNYDVVKLPVSKKEFGASGGVKPVLLSGEAAKFLGGSSNRLKLCSPFIGLSGHVDKNLYDSENIISSIRPELYADYKVIPVFRVVEDKNAYAWDYYNHGQKKALLHDNRLPASDIFALLKDFILVVQTIYLSLVEMTDSRDEAKNDVVVRAFKQLVAEFNLLWVKDFPDARGF
jgi:ERCC4-related helicase